MPYNAPPSDGPLLVSAKEHVNFFHHIIHNLASDINIAEAGRNALRFVLSIQVRATAYSRDVLGFSFVPSFLVGYSIRCTTLSNRSPVAREQCEKDVKIVMASVESGVLTRTTARVTFERQFLLIPYKLDSRHAGLTLPP